MNRNHPPMALAPSLDLRLTVTKVWLVEATMHSHPITAMFLRGKKPSRLFIEGDHTLDFHRRLSKDVVIHFEYGRIKKVSTPEGEVLWQLKAGSQEMAKYATHWCKSPETDNHWTHLLDPDMPPLAVELGLQEVAKSHAKASLADIAAGLVLFHGKIYWKKWARGPVAYCYVRDPANTGMDFYPILINSIQGLPQKHSHWLDFVAIGSEKGRLVFGYPRFGAIKTTLRQFLESQGIK